MNALFLKIKVCYSYNRGGFMNSILEFFTSKEIIIVYAVTGVACLLYFIISVIDKYSYKRKRRHNTRELNRIVKAVNEKIGEEKPIISNENVLAVPEIQPVYIEPILEVVEEKVVEVNNVVEEIEELEVEEGHSTVVEPLEVSLSDTQKIEDLIVQSEMLEEKARQVLEEPIVIEPVIEDLTYTDIEPNQTEAQMEILRLTQELEKASESTQNIALTSYEEQQEKEAIISLDELMQKTKTMYDNNELSAFDDEGNEPISLADLEKKMQEVNAVMIETEENVKEEAVGFVEPVQEKLTLDDFNTIKVDVVEESKPLYQEFKSTPIISPVYGLERKESSITDIELENTANYEKLDEEIRRTNEFIMTLKELQKNLD